MTPDNVVNANAPRCGKCDNIPRCPDCGSVSLFVHPTVATKTLAKYHIESRVTCAECGSFRILNKFPPGS